MKKLYPSHILFNLLAITYDFQLKLRANREKWN